DKHESATFRLAVPRNGSDGADFIDIVTFDKLAGTCAQWLTKGREVAVVGKLRLSEWTSRDGERRSKVQVVADAVTFLGAPKTAGDPQRGRRRAGRQARRTAQGQLNTVGGDHSTFGWSPRPIAGKETLLTSAEGRGWRRRGSVPTIRVW